MNRLISLWLCFVLVASSAVVLVGVRADPGTNNLIDNDSDLIISTPYMDAPMYHGITPSIENDERTASQTPQLMGSVFIENRGQLNNSEVSYYLGSGSGGIAFSLGSVMMTTIERDENVSAEMPTEEFDRKLMEMEYYNKQVSRKGNAIKLNFVNANEVVPNGRNPAPWQNNYFIGNDSSQWRTNVPNYREIVYENLWDGIDLIYYTKDGNLKYDFIVHPYADYTKIKVKAEGHDCIAITNEGDLMLGTGLDRISDLMDTNLDVFYADNKREKIPACFSVEKDTYTFQLGDIDSSRRLVIDPLVYSTFIGDFNWDSGSDIAVDSMGCAYVTGFTSSTSFPTTAGAFDIIYNGIDDVFVAKLNQTGESLVYSTFLGGSNYDWGYGITVDGSGYAYVIGVTYSTDFYTTVGAYDIVHNGYSDIFIAKLNQTGGSLVYSTFLGGSEYDSGNDIAIDSSGCAYITGGTDSTNFPITAGVFDATTNGFSDAFVAKLSQNGGSLVYSTFLGGDTDDCGCDIAIDNNGYAYVTGRTNSAIFPTTAGAFDTMHNGGYDVFVTKLAQNGGTLVYSTFLGGTDYDRQSGIAVDGNGYAYVTGYTRSTGFPTTVGAFDTTHNGYYDIFVTKLTQNGGSLVYSTFLGGGGYDGGGGIVVDGSENVCISGHTEDNITDFPTTAGAFDTMHNGGYDVFVTKLAQNGRSLVYSTFLGGSAADSVGGITLGNNGYAYVVGGTTSNDYPTKVAYDTSYNGNMDVFIAKLELVDVTPPIANAGTNQTVGKGAPVTFDGSSSNDNVGIVNYTWTFNDGIENITLYGESPIYTFTVLGFYIVILNVTDANGNWATDNMTVTVNDTTDPVANAGLDQMVDEGAIVTFNGNASLDNVGITNYTWTFIDSVLITRYSVGPTYQFNNPGIFAVTLTVQDVVGNTDSDTMNVTVNDITSPSANAGTDQTVNVITKVFFDGSASDDNVGIVNYTWTFTDVIPITLYGPNPIRWFYNVGVFNITLTVRDAAGNTNTDIMTITIQDITVPVANAGLDLQVNEGAIVTFDGSVSTDNLEITNYTWTFTDNVLITRYSVGPIYQFNNPGIFVVTLTVQDAAGNTDTDTMNVTVNDITSPSANAGTDQIVNVGTIVTFDGSASNDNIGIVNYTWMFTYNESQITLYGVHPTFQFWTSSNYTLTLTVSDVAGNQAADIMLISVASNQPTPENETRNNISDYWWVILIIISVMLVIGAIVLKMRQKNLEESMKKAPKPVEAMKEDSPTLETEPCPKCGFDIETGGPCPFCTEEPPLKEPEPAPPKPRLTNDEMLAQIEQSYKEGKMTEVQYLKNIAKFKK